MSRARSVGWFAAASLLPALFLLPWWVANPRFFWNDDFQYQYLGAFSEVARAWLSGDLPLLATGSWAAGNLAGEYQYGTLSLWANAWQVMLHVSGWPLAFRAAVYALVHLGVLSGGAYVLARSRGLGVAYGVLVAVCASLNGYMVLWGAVDWITAVSSFCWLPWFWWCLEGAARGGSRQRAHLAGVAGFTYLMLSAGWPFTVLMGAAVFVVVAGAAALGGKSGPVVRAVIPAAAAGAFLALPALLLLAENLAASGRGGVAMEPSRVLTFPLESLPAIVAPGHRAVWITFFGGAEHPFFEWSGAVVPLVALAAAHFRGARRSDLLLAALALAFALAPGIGVFRWSFRWIPLFHLALALAGATALASRAGDAPAAGRKALLRAMLWVGLAGVSGSVMVSWPLRVSAPAMAGIGVLACWAAGVRTLDWAMRGRVAALVAAGGLAFTYALFPLNPLTPRWGFSEAILRPAPLEPDRLYLSLHEPPERMVGQPGESGALLRPGNTGFFSGVRLINGYSPVAPRGVFDLLGLGTHGDASRRVVRDVLSGSGHAHRLLALAGVDGLILSPFYAAFPENLGDEWREHVRSPEGLVLHREPRLGREAALLVTTDGHRGAGSVVRDRPVSVVRDARHSVEVQVPATETPCHVMFRRPWFPGYRAFVDGRPAPVENVFGLSPGVRLAAGGPRAVRLEYRPAGVRWLPVCWGLAVLAGCAAFFGSIRPGRIRR